MPVLKANPGEGYNLESFASKTGMYMFYSRIFEKVVRAFRQLLGSLVEAQEETLSEFLEPCREDRFSFLDLARASWKKGQLEHIMKLKRFLLRYDPPGVGLEVEADDQVTVQHKNLPAKSEVSTSKEVHALVDQLIEAEPALLTRKRHREGLIQLLGRLYQVETAEEERPSEPQDAAEDPKDRDELHGQSVVLTGLSGSQQAFNGEVAVVVKAKGDKQKYEVEVKGQVVKVKGKEHLLQVSSKGPLAAGAFVAIRGLRNHVELNGCVARVAECHEESQRYEVRALDSGQLFRVKKDNVILIETTPAVLAASAAMKENREPNTSPRKEGTLPATGETDDVLEVGSTVELVGLKTAQAYNGQQAEVLSVDQVRGRYEIRLGDGSVKTIRAENVRLIQGKSPRTKRGRDKLL